MSGAAPDIRLPAEDDDAEMLLQDGQFSWLVRWCFVSRLICLAIASPVIFWFEPSPVAVICLVLLIGSSLALSRSVWLIRQIIRHPLWASADVLVSALLILAVPVGQPAVLTVISTALIAGMLFPSRVLALLIVPLMFATMVPMIMGQTGTALRDVLLTVTGLPVIVLGVALIGAVVRITVRRLVQAQTEVAAAQSEKAAADERARLARDMHDSVGKSLHGISLAARSLPRALERSPELATQTADELARAAEVAAREAREILVDLRRGEQDRPMIEVVTEVVGTWSDRSGIPVAYGGVRAVDCPPAVVKQLVPSLQEMLHNVEKHARATAVEVELLGDAETVTVVVRDNGVGIPEGRMSRAIDGGHYGLKGIGERAELVGGGVSVETPSGGGTEIRWTATRQ